MSSLLERASAYLRELQDCICDALEQLDGARFQEDLWTRGGDGGGGRTRVIQGGQVFEKGGVNFSEVAGEMAPELLRTLPGDGTHFFATGMSLVLHPRSPMVPTVHANFRYLGRGATSWFGGGADLTPHYLFAQDAQHFHHTFAQACERYQEGAYARFKAECDRYFFLPHRGEARGVGGIFFDYLQDDHERTFGLVRDCGDAFLPAYLPIVERRRGLGFGDRERAWQLLRRGRYVEFNLLYDRGTTFGLKTGGRTESILMSLPPEVRWEYDAAPPPPGSREAELLACVRSPRDWI
jgi:coproporphyrinogen III oxidase